MFFLRYNIAVEVLSYVKYLPKFIFLKDIAVQIFEKSASFFVKKIVII